MKAIAIPVASVFLLVLLATPVEARERGRNRDGVSPVLKIERGPRDASRDRPEPRRWRRVGIRTIDGSDNNRNQPNWGAAHTPLLRTIPADYGDGVSSPAGADRPSPRAVSNHVAIQETLIPNPLGTSDYLWQWGQFLDHDIDLTDGAEPPEPEPISVPPGDPWFDPLSTGIATIPFNRSIYAHETGAGTNNPREQLNEITSYIDASNVYGSDADRAQALRTLDGTGRLKTSEGDLLPFNVDGLPNAGGSGPELFLAGDVRANEQAGLAAMHTLFVREHNRLAERYAVVHPDWDGERLYQAARRMVGAQMQVITYREFLPALLGPEPLTIPTSTPELRMSSPPPPSASVTAR